MPGCKLDPSSPSGQISQLCSHNPPCDLSPACQHDGRMLKSPMFRYNSRKPMHPKLRYHPQFKNESRKSEKLGGIYFHSFCICFIWSDGGLSQQYWLDPHSSTHPQLQLIPTLTAIWPRAIPTSTILSSPNLRATPAVQPLPHPSRDLRTRPPNPTYQRTATILPCARFFAHPTRQDTHPHASNAPSCLPVRGRYTRADWTHLRCLVIKQNITARIQSK
jgi:hypothetical protein